MCQPAKEERGCKWERREKENLCLGQAPAAAVRWGEHKIHGAASQHISCSSRQLSLRHTVILVDPDNPLSHQATSRLLLSCNKKCDSARK